MKVLKIEKAMLAFIFFVVNGEDSFDYLEKDVKSEGGTVERVSDNLAIVSIDGASYTLPLGFAVIINGGVGKIVSQEVFDNEYVGEDSGYGSLFDSLNGRLIAVEEEIAKLKATAGSNTRVRKDRSSING